jgi:hypothetical protein
MNQDASLPLNDLESAAPVSGGEGSTCGIDSQATGPASRKLENHTIYLEIDGRDTNAAVSVWAVASQVGRPSLPMGNTEGIAQQCIGTLISHFNKRQHEFTKGFSLRTPEDRKQFTSRSSHANHLAGTKKFMKELMIKYNETREEGESGISFMPVKLPQDILTEHGYASISSRTLISWSKKAPRGLLAATEASASSTVITDTPE